MDCGCGRSSIGKCIGWHYFDEKQYQEELKKWKKKKKISKNILSS